MAGLLMVASLQALRRGNPAVDAEDLLEAFARRGAPFLQAFAVDPEAVLAAIAVKRSGPRSGPGAGEGDEREVLESHELEVDALLREVRWRLCLKYDLPIGQPAPAFTAAVRAALRAAFVCAELYGRRNVSLAHLMVGMLQVPGCDAVRLIEGLSDRPSLLLANPPLELMKLEGRPLSDAVDTLDRLGQLVAVKEAATPVPWLMRMGDVFARGAKSMIQAMNRDACRLAVRYDAAHVNQAHYLLAIFLLQRHLDVWGRRLRGRWAAHNDAGDLLRHAGVKERPLVESVVHMRIDEPAEHLKSTRKVWRRISPPFGHSVFTAIERAEKHAVRLQHPYTGTQHLLLGLLEEGGAATQVLQQLNVDAGQLREAAAQDLRQP